GRDEDDVDIDDFANEIIERFATYAEVSPSGKGIKLFFLVTTRDMEGVQQLLGWDHDRKPKTRKGFTAGEHREVALDRARYYAVTGRWLEGARRFRTVPVADVRWFIEQAGPRFQHMHRPADSTERHPTRDESGSGYGYRFFASCKALHQSFEQAWRAIQNDTGKAGEWARRSDTRQLQRAWDNAVPHLHPDFNQPTRRNLAPAVTAEQLETMSFEPMKYVVPEVIVEGLTIMGGKPKVGKSFMMLHIANAVAKGSTTLGGTACEQGDVLYCALEDNLRRLQSRLQKMRLHGPPGLPLRPEMPRLNEGGLDLIRDWARSVERPRLAIIDTWKRVRPQPPSGTRSSQYD